MNLSTLKPAKGSTKSSKRVGRGQGSGRGGTSTKGHKGHKATSGYKSKPGFEGGQMPLQRRVPKFGFKNFNRVEYKPINVDVLQALAEEQKVKEINAQFLKDHGLISGNDLYKILSRGEIKAALTIEAHKFSEVAKKKIEAAGGSVKIIG